MTRERQRLLEQRESLRAQLAHEVRLRADRVQLVLDVVRVLARRLAQHPVTLVNRVVDGRALTLQVVMETLHRAKRNASSLAVGQAGGLVSGK